MTAKKHPAPYLCASLLFIILQTSCSRPPESPKFSSREPIDVRIEERHDEKPSEEFLEKFQPDLRMVAYRSDDGEVNVRVMNRSERKFGVDASMFGVLFADGETRRIERDTARYQFPSILLGPGELATGKFRFHKAKDLTRAYLIFKSPDSRVRPSRCEIDHIRD